MTILSKADPPCNELTRSAQVAQFLAPFTRKPDHLLIQLFSLPAKRSRFVRDITGALIDELIAEADAGEDLYVGVGLSPHDYGPHRRCPAADIAGLVSLWADIDIVHSVHKKTNLPPNEAAARALLAELAVPPSVVVHSGHGLQAWWWFREPWIFADPEERLQAAQLAGRWNHAMQRAAVAHGWAVDAVHDLSRLMRLPATFNWKGAR